MTKDSPLESITFGMQTSLFVYTHVMARLSYGKVAPKGCTFTCRKA
jgi:hypothetical protein